MLFVFVRHHHVRTREQTFVDMHFLVSGETCGHILIRCHSVLMSMQCGLWISLPFVGRRVKTGSGCILQSRFCCGAVDIAMELAALVENEKCGNDRR